jgi:DNA-binding LytR/AlgR family response regulator
MEIKTIQIDTDTFLVFKGIEYRQINIEDIVSLEALNKYVLIVTKDCRKFVIGCSLTAILKKLCIEYIIVTKGFLINKKYLLELTKEVSNKDKYNLVLNDSEHTTKEVSSYIAKNILEQL